MVKRIVVWVGSLLLATLLVTLSLVGRDATRILEADAKDFLSQVASFVGESTRRDLGQVRSDLEAWAAMPALREAAAAEDDAALRDLLVGLTATRDLVGRLVVLDGAGRVLAATEDGPAPAGAWVEAARTSAEVQASLGWRAAGGAGGGGDAAHLSLARGLGEAGAVLVCEVDLRDVRERLQAILDQARAGGMASLDVVLVDAEARVLVSRNGLGDGRRVLEAARPLLDDPSLVRFTRGDVDLAGVPSLVSASILQLGDQRGALVATRSQGEALAPARRLDARLRWIAMTAWLLTLLAVAAVVRRIAAPLEGYVTTLTEHATFLDEASQEQSVSTTQQATSIREMSTTVTEVLASLDSSKGVAEGVVQKAQISLQASHEGMKAAQDARRGMDGIGASVGTMTTTVEQLSEQVGSIESILGAVNDLAEQSKFLALNAAIEAARAGEHGKGFGVVSVEVRSLAQQSQEATGQIKQILDQIASASRRALEAAREGGDQSHRGQEVVQRTEVTIGALADAIRQSREAADQILGAVNQQGLGVEQIAAAMNQIEQAVTQTVTLATEVARVAKELAEVSEGLSGLVEGRR